MSDKLFDLTGKRVWVAGHRGMVGSALVRRLRREDCTVLTANREQINLLSLTGVYRWIEANKPDLIIVAAGRVGGIQANSKNPVGFFNENLAIGSNIINSAALLHTPKLVYLGAPCIYPRDCKQPMQEASLMTGKLEPTNEAYAMAKLSCMALARFYRQQEDRDFVTAIPTNLYGPGDSLDPEKNHVVPALIMKILAAKEKNESVSIWGDGSPVRQLMHVDDAADGIIHVAKNYSSEFPINIASGNTVTIEELFERLAAILGYLGPVAFDTSKPNGMPYKALNGSRLWSNWMPKIELQQGLQETCAWVMAELERQNNANTSK